MIAGRAVPSLAALLALGTGAPAAHAASVSIPNRCREARQVVDFVGVEFRRGARFTASLGERVVARGRVSAVGDVSGSFRAPRPTRSGPGERTYTLTVTDGRRRSTARFTAVVFGADFRPATGDPAALRVRFSVFGFGPGRAVYLHYIRPSRRLRRTVLLGRARGHCGSLTTSPRRAFPFQAEPGDWRLQFDTVRAYDRTPPAPFVRMVVPILRR